MKKSTSKNTTKEDGILVNGTVLEALRDAMFKVRLETGQDIIAHISGKIRKNYIHILPFDAVSVNLSIYDLKRGRIIKRM